MSSKRFLLLLAVLAAAGADVLFYGGSRQISRASRLADPSARIEILAGGTAFIKTNDVVERDLGRAAFEAAVADLTAVGPRDDGLRRAHAAFLESLALNPLSAATHFDLAQTLDYMKLFDLPVGEKPVDEYVKAIQLAGQDPEILAASGRALVSSWASLDPQQRIMARDITRTVLAARPVERLDEIFELWAVRIQDPAFMRAVLPADPDAYRAYARFLAERGLDRGERIHFLAEAEALELARAGEAAAAGRSDFLAARIKEAEGHYRSGLKLLDGLLFYRNLEPAAAAPSSSAIQELRKALLLGVARCRLETSRSFDAILPELKEYLAAEDSAAAVAELEKSLRERRLIEAKPDASGKDMRRLAFELEMIFRQSRYREVIEYGQSLEAGLVMITEAVRSDYAAILEIVGDAYQKLDFLYESNRFYQKARESFSSPGLILIEKMAKNYERLNDAAALAALRKEAAGFLSPRTVDWTGITVPRGTSFKHSLVLEPRHSKLTLKASPPGPLPAYVTVVMNGRVIWEDFVSDAPIVLVMTPESGNNDLEITPWNGPLVLAGLEIELQEPEGEKGAGKKAPPETAKGVH
ncbi:MAG: hypothetical protein PHI34_08115 [Acidobacteriota bacterium]|nr:hypothetical protein [Acidobacteriota bacterium]